MANTAENNPQCSDSDESDDSQENLEFKDEDDDEEVEKWDPSKDVYVPAHLVTREKWGAVPPKYREPLCVPVRQVLLLDTKTDFCLCEDTCGVVLRDIQRHYMEEKGLPDIPWNFMIGEDGKVYEGRGWVTNPDKVLPETEKHHCASLDIAYIGSYQVKPPTGTMTRTLNKLLDIGLTKAVIDGDYSMKSELMNDFDEEYYKEHQHEIANKE